MAKEQKTKTDITWRKNKMRAAIINKFGGPEVIEIADIEKPEPKEKEVLVKNVAVGVGKPDSMVRSGIYPFLKKQPPMLTIGNECSGYVEAIGKDVTKVKVGDPVWVIHNPGYGACAEYICVDEQYVTPLPSGMNPLNAVGLLNYFIGYCLLHEAGRGTDGKSLYILGGAGGVGTALIKMALADGWEVISAADTEEKCEHLRKIGTTHVFNCITQDEKQMIMEFTNGRGVDLVYDQWVGEKLYKELDLLADFGMIVVYNWLEGEPKESFYPHMIENATKCTGVRVFSSHIYDNRPERLKEIQKNVFELLMSGKIDMNGYFYGDFGLEDVIKAHELLDSQKTYGKIILKL